MCDFDVNNIMIYYWSIFTAHDCCSQIEAQQSFSVLHISTVTIVGVGKETPNNGSMMLPEKAAPVTETTLRATCPVPAYSR